MSFYIDVFLMKKHDGTNYKSVYYVMLDKCDQDLLDILNIAEIVAEKFCQDHNEIKSLFIKSDNATPELVHNILKKYKIQLEQYDFSEPQKGKDACDREAAYGKQKLRIYLDKSLGHKVSNAKDLLHAIISDGGPKNSKGIVLCIDNKKSMILRKPILSGISSYHSFAIKTETVICQEYFGIGIIHKFM